MIMHAYVVFVYFSEYNSLIGLPILFGKNVVRGSFVVDVNFGDILCYNCLFLFSEFVTMMTTK